MIKFSENKKLNESSLNRLISKIQDADCGTITAFRGFLSKSENLIRNKALLNKLLSYGYSVTSIDGVYIENFVKPDAKEVKENVFFVHNIGNKRNIKKDLIELAKQFDQDSILYIHKSGDYSELIGTNDTGYPGLGKSVKFPILKVARDNYQFLSKVNGRPFYFTENITDEKLCGNNSSKFLAEKDYNKYVSLSETLK